MTKWIVERITVSDVKRTTDKASPLHPGLEAVRQELFAELSPTEFQNRYTRLLRTDGQKVAQTPQVNGRGAEAYWIRDGLDPIAVMILHFYNWQTLAPQICIRAMHRDNENINLGLVRFEELVKSQSTPHLVAELTSFWVAVAYRRQGLGKLLFKKALDAFDKLLEKGDFGFIMVRGKLAKDKSKVIFQYLLANEEKVNGRSCETNQVRITCLTIPIEELNSALGFECRYLPIHSDSIPTAMLAKRADMKFMGYSRMTNSIYGKIWE